KRLSKRIAGDLDSIVLRAMQKAPRDRYSTAAQFADDIRNHLAHRPVLARPATATYRLLKYTRRNRGAVAAAALILAALTGGIVVSMHSAQIATRHFQSVRRLARVFVFDVHDAVRDLPGSTPARQIIVRTGIEYLDNLAKDSGGDPDLEAEVAVAYQRIGEIQHANLGNSRAALESYQKTIRLLDSIARKRPSDTRTQRARITALANIGELYANSRSPKEALASYGEALRVASAIAPQESDEAIQKQRATILLRRAHLERFMEDISGSLNDAAQALGILRDLVARHPEDHRLQDDLAGAYSTVGMAQARLDRLDAALESYRKAVAPMEMVTRAEPTNASFQRELMLVYSHVGDVLGNPQMPNLGNAAGAEEAYRKMLGVAETSWNADRTDQRAIGDYGLATMRVAMVTPASRLPVRITLFRKALGLLNQVAAVNPKNAFNGLNIAYVQMEIGNALQASGDPAGAEQKFREAAATSEAVLALGANSSSVQTTLLMSSRKLGQALAQRGEREQALAWGQKALSVAGTPAAGASLGLRAAIPRAYAALGAIHAELASSSRIEAKQRRQDMQDAIQWFEKARDHWRSMSAEPGFHVIFRKHMEETITSLTALQRRMEAQTP
ncbi:MAG: tetratricopeptide repeat protein, partial [Bryobacteraceae bacterium]|nr:tetratricopeptide repeat protein [Bryobacteraceae bacterium]